MQNVEGPQTPFEVFCHQCRVTFPIGTKRCIHCGARLGRERMEPKLVLPPLPAEETGEETGIGRGGIFSPMTSIWLLLALAGAMYRACSSS